MLMTPPATHQQDLQDQFKACYKSCLRLLERKDYSRKKIFQKLKEKDYESDIINKVLDEVTEKKFLRQDYYQEARIKGLMRKGYHPQSIQQKLFEDGCNPTIEEIENIFNEYQTDTKKEGFSLIEKKARSLNLTSVDGLPYEELQKKKVKLIRFLLSKGYPLEDARDCLNHFIASIKLDRII